MKMNNFNWNSRKDFERMNQETLPSPEKENAMNRTWKLALIGAMALGLTAGCVDQQPSLVMQGSVVGNFDEEIGGCEYNLDFSDTRLLNTSGFINLADFENGQPIAPGEARLGAGRYFFSAIFENRLVDSRNVGAEGSGGSGGGFDGLYQNSNDIQVTSATVTLREDANTFRINNQNVAFPDLSRERLFTMLVQTNQGTGLVNIPLLNGPRDAQVFEEFLASTVPADEPLTFIVEIQLHGETLAGNRVESNRFEYPLQICRDCGIATTPLCAAGGS